MQKIRWSEIILKKKWTFIFGAYCLEIILIKAVFNTGFLVGK